MFVLILLGLSCGSVRVSGGCRAKVLHLQSGPISASMDGSNDRLIVIGHIPVGWMLQATHRPTSHSFSVSGYEEMFFFVTVHLFVFV